MEKLTGILLPIFSLPGNYGIGRFGKEAYKWVDILSDLGWNAWQVCPMGPVGFGNSPYQPISETYLNPLFIDLEPWVENGFLDRKDLEQGLCRKKSVAYDFIETWQMPLLLKVYENFITHGDTSNFEKFKTDEGNVLQCFCTFCALKHRFEQKPWWEWPKEYHHYNSSAVNQYINTHHKFVDFFAFEQWILHQQWQNLHTYAKSKHVHIIGDIPLYVGTDSAIVWQNRELFEWDDAIDYPQYVAGVPPDYFSSNGQLWGNPVYNWDYHVNTHFAWWMERIRKNLEWFDLVRIDHFRGLYDYWRIPYGAETAQKGEWCSGPQYKFFDALKEHWPHMPFILEDLGDLNDNVRSFQKNLGLPGMAIIQFAFDGYNNPYRPENWQKNQVIYTGTHDNNTTRGWFSTLDENQKNNVCAVLGFKKTSENTICSKIIAWIRRHRTTQHVIFPLQDLLNLGAEARINTPGTTIHNWQWRCTKTQLKNFSVEAKTWK
jgi:4-alpha-glucanotransferase